jgi:alcohol dehydrogenase YqhD (iron-dependent ADH family)
MNSFEFYNPVRVIFGEGVLERSGVEAKKLGKKALLVTYANQPFFAGLIQRVTELLAGQGVETVVFAGVSPNPRMNEVHQGVELCKQQGADFVIGLGGGSAMDSAKMIAAGALYPGELWNMVYSRHDESKPVAPPQEALPLMMIPTLPATGSEMNSAAVVTNEATHEKSYTWGNCLYSQVSIVDPTLTTSLPPYQTACAAADTISHALEFYLTGQENTPLNYYFQEGVILTVIDNVQRVLKDPADLNARANLQWSSIVALSGWIQPGDGWIPMHQLAHVISARFEIAHGATMAIIMPAWMKHYHTARPERYVEFARHIFNVDPTEKTREEIALEGIRAFESFLQGLGLPTRLRDVSIGAEMIEPMTADVVKISFGKDGRLFSRPPVTEEDVRAIYKLAV